MNYKGTLTLKAEQLDVWEFVLDVDKFAACMPGVEELVMIDDKTFDGVIRAKVGPMSGSFDFRAGIIESDPPNQLAAHVEGLDSMTKSTMTSDVSMTLSAGAPGETELAYQAVVNVRGRLAIIGDMVLRATGAQMIEEIFQRLRPRVENEPPDPV